MKFTRSYSFLAHLPLLFVVAGLHAQCISFMPAVDKLYDEYAIYYRTGPQPIEGSQKYFQPIGLKWVFVIDTAGDAEIKTALDLDIDGKCAIFDTVNRTYTIAGLNWAGEGVLIKFNDALVGVDTMYFENYMFYDYCIYRDRFVAISGNKLYYLDADNFSMTDIKINTDNLWSVASNRDFICTVGSEGRIALINNKKKVQYINPSVPVDEYWEVINAGQYFIALASNSFFVFDENGLSKFEKITPFNIMGAFSTENNSRLVVVGGGGEFECYDLTAFDKICTGMIPLDLGSGMQSNDYRNSGEKARVVAAISYFHSTLTVARSDGNYAFYEVKE